MPDELEQVLAALRAMVGPQVLEEAERNWKPPVVLEIDARSIILDWLIDCGLTKGRDEDIDFYVTAFREGKLNYRDIRKRGAAMDPHERRSLKMRGKAIVTSDYINTLSKAGLADPLAAAERIAGPAASRCEAAKRLAQLSAHKLDAELLPSNGAAGPCAAAHAAQGSLYDPDEAPLLPLTSCTHPEQCFCMYRAHLKA